MAAALQSVSTVRADLRGFFDKKPTHCMLRDVFSRSDDCDTQRLHGRIWRIPRRRAAGYALLFVRVALQDRHHHSSE